MQQEMPAYSFEEAFKQWNRIPVDDLDYFNSEELLALTNSQLLELGKLSATLRYNPGGYRNLNNTYYKFMQLDKVRGKRVMDYGCGLGLDAMTFAQNGALITLADMHPINLYIANQVVASLTKVIAERLVITLCDYPWFFLSHKVDLFWSFGVLHHTPHIAQILKRACGILTPEGEIRIALYSDKCWERAIGLPFPTGPTWKDPRFAEFVKKQDCVGLYADFYTEEKIKNEVSEFAEVVECQSIGDGQFLGVVIKPKT